MTWTLADTPPLVAFLSDVLDRAERRAVAASRGRPHWLVENACLVAYASAGYERGTGHTIGAFSVSLPVGEYVMYRDPAAELARIHADRLILAAHTPGRHNSDGPWVCLTCCDNRCVEGFPGEHADPVVSCCDTLRIMALPYRYERGYQTAWDVKEET